MKSGSIVANTEIPEQNLRAADNSKISKRVPLFYDSDQVISMYSFDISNRDIKTPLKGISQQILFV
jgi:hypothetical protein